MEETLALIIAKAIYKRWPDEYEYRSPLTDGTDGYSKELREVSWEDTDDKRRAECLEVGRQAALEFFSKCG